MGIGYNYSEANNHANLAAAGDIDGDGKPDLASVNIATGAGNMAASLNQSTVGSFSFPTRTAVAFGTTPAGSIAMGDFDGDGKPDIACTIEASNEVYVFRNNSTTGNIRFAARVTIPAAVTSPQYLEFCDLNGDGIPDLIVANSTGLAVQAAVSKPKYIPVKLPF